MDDTHWTTARRDALLILLAQLGLLSWGWERGPWLALLGAGAAALLAWVSIEVLGPAMGHRAAGLLLSVTLLLPALLAANAAFALTAQLGVALLVGVVVAAWLLWLIFWQNREASNGRME